MSARIENINAIVDQHQAARKAIFEHVGYVEDWVVYPISDKRDSLWRIVGGDKRGAGGELLYADNKDALDNPYKEGAECYSAVVYTQRFLPRWVYRGPDLTLVVGDTQCDGNKFLFILDNAKET